MKKKSGSINDENNPNISRRRSRNQIEGRTHTCPTCLKSYLSYPALYTHRKLKHMGNNNTGRGRGRPKKDQNENIIEKNRYNPINITYFAKEGRTGKTTPKEIDECIDNAFLDLYIDDENIKRNDARNMKDYQSIEEHPFLIKFKMDNHDIYKNVINIHETIDKIFIDYLNKMSVFCDKKYFTELIKFVTLFREYINIMNRRIDNKNNNQEYTDINDAENIANYSNGFINKFLYPKGEDNDFFSFVKDESIDLVQNICYWMYDNNFTPYKIILKDKK
jgi:hypothetical protein